MTLATVACFVLKGSWYLFLCNQQGKHFIQRLWKPHRKVGLGFKYRSETTSMQDFVSSSDIYFEMFLLLSTEDPHQGYLVLHTAAFPPILVKMALF